MDDIAIKKVREVQIELLDIIDEICKKHNIKYQLFAGTLLGAVRHKGFIPWDDDVDICMMREDYIKFLQVAPNEINNSLYYIQTPYNDKSPFAFSKFRKNNTLFVEQIIDNYNSHQGIFIDIFQFDNVYINSIKNILFQSKINFLFKIIFVKTIYKNEGSSLKYNFIYKLAARIIDNLYRKEFYYYVRKLDKVCMKFNFRKTKHVAQLTCMQLNKRNFSGWYYQTNDFLDPILLEFEGKKYPCPRRYHELLSLEYGNYLIPPPPEKRKPHHGISKVVIDGVTYFNQN